MSAYKLISTKGTKTVHGTIVDAIAAAKEMDAELQPSFGITVEDGDGNTVTEVRDGEVGEYSGDPAICPACGGDPMLCECVTPWSEE